MDVHPATPIRHLLGLIGPLHHVLTRRRIGPLSVSTLVLVAFLLLAAWAIVQAGSERARKKSAPHVSVTDLAAHTTAPEQVRVRGVALYSAAWQEAHRAPGTDSTRAARYFYLLTDGESAIPVVSANDPSLGARDTAHVDLRAAVLPLPPLLGTQLASDTDVVASFSLIDTMHYLQPLAEPRAAVPWTLVAAGALVFATVFALSRRNVWTV